MEWLVLNVGNLMILHPCGTARHIDPSVHGSWQKELTILSVVLNQLGPSLSPVTRSGLLARTWLRGRREQKLFWKFFDCKVYCSFNRENPHVICSAMTIPKRKYKTAFWRLVTKTC